MARRKFPVLAVILLLFAVVWILSDMEIISVNLPWIPVILAIIAVGMIFNRLSD